MIKQGEGGRMIIISSTAGKRGVARYAAYCTSKFGLVGFTQALALELAPHRINVNAICPGLTDTERVTFMAAALAPEGVSKEDYHAQMLRAAASSAPLGRVATPADIAQVAAFLASPASDYVTGLSIPVSGGSVM
jgi:NAD(P)-dependent dehydrogenase (short-subunit alcohol dehydrogenase family)